MRSTPNRRPRSAPSTPCAPPVLNFNSTCGRSSSISGEPHEGYEFTDEHATGAPYRWAVLGAVVGGTGGLLLTTLSQKSYPILTGGMSLTPAWTNGIIVYEMIMLGAILTTLVVLLIGAGLPNFKGVITDPEIWTRKILVGVVDAPENSQPELEKRLLQAGASQVKQSV